jgi:hypothetical protein
MTEKTADTKIPEDTLHTPKRSGGTGKTPLSERQLIQLESMWASGEYTSEQLGKKFGRTGRSIMNLMKARGAKKGELSEEITERVREKMVDKIVSEASITAERTKETKEDHYRMASAIAKLTWMEVAKSQKEGRAFSTITGSMKALNLAMGVLEKARSERYAVLGLNVEKDDDGVIPELVVNELSQEQIAELRNRDFSAPGQRDAEKLLEEVLDTKDEMKFDDSESDEDED